MNYSKNVKVVLTGLSNDNGICSKFVVDQYYITMKLQKEVCDQNECMTNCLLFAYAGYRIPGCEGDTYPGTHHYWPPLCWGGKVRIYEFFYFMQLFYLFHIIPSTIIFL